MPTYQDLINVNGEIRTKTGKKFKDPTELARAMGIDAKTIDWSKISKGTGYEGLVNAGGEIQTQAGQAFKSPAELAGSLGIQPHEIDWSKITPKTSPITPTSPLGEVISQKGEEDPRQAIIKQLTETFQNVTKGIGTVDYGARFKELREEAGLGGISERIGTLDTEIAKTEDLLKNLEQDILERSKEELVTAPATRRLEAVERAPLITQLGELERSRGIESGMLQRGREDILTQLGLEKGERSDILSQLQTATQIAGLQQKLMAEGVETQVVDKGTSKVLINKNTGEVIQEFNVAEAPKALSELDKSRIREIEARIASEKDEKDININTAQQNLTKVGLSAGIINNDGSLRKDDRIKIIDTGVPPNIVDTITEAIIGGDSLDTIRTDLKNLFGQEVGFGYLDTYMQTLQDEDKDKFGDDLSDEEFINFLKKE